MALEVAAFRIIGRSFGSALRETTTVIAVFLAAMSAGYWLGGRAGDRRPRPSTLVATLLFSAAVLMFVPLIDATLSPVISASNLALATHAFAATTVLFAIPTLLLAATSPIAIRLFATTTGESGKIAGSISAISTAGSIAGSLVTAFFLIDWLESINRTVLFVATGCCITAAMVAAAALPRMSREAASRTRMRRLAAGGVLAALAIVIPTFAFVRSSAIDRSLLKPSANTKILWVAESPYHRITVFEGVGNRRMLSFDEAVQTMMLTHDPNGRGLPYSDSLHLARMMRPQVRKVLLIGLGGGTPIRQFNHYYGDVEFDAVDIDPLVVKASQDWFHLVPGPKLRLHVADGRTFLRRSNQKWDLIILDAYTQNRYGATIPPQLVTREFFEELKEHLTDGGIVHYHSAFGGRMTHALHRTLESVFTSVLISGGGELLASDVALQASKETLHERARMFGGKLPMLKMYIDTLSDEPPPMKDVPLLTDDFAPADSLLRNR